MFFMGAAAAAAAALALMSDDLFRSSRHGHMVERHHHTTTQITTTRRTRVHAYPPITHTSTHRFNYFYLWPVALIIPTSLHRRSEAPPWPWPWPITAESAGGGRGERRWGGIMICERADKLVVMHPLPPKKKKKKHRRCPNDSHSLRREAEQYFGA
ncbi:hypothetical protein B0F90DRAFT_395854 [Multifurca ochricompacta]|uniref:Secreted protein n=1 Tax=Multifurca ochricompacta TaxID=376703 RepID=A0AAD4QKU5_9AGAM|nr:hypothetical protein B0F90DRAFT_395854 [Multifurca ochricompacta]